MSRSMKEKASFTIVNGNTVVSFKVDGSTVVAIREAFSFLSPERRLKVLAQLQAKQATLLEREGNEH